MGADTTTLATHATSTALAAYNPRMKVAYFTAKQHAIGAAYTHRMRNSSEEMLDRLETEPDDAVYRRVVRQLGFDPRDGVTS